MDVSLSPRGPRRQKGLGRRSATQMEISRKNQWVEENEEIPGNLSHSAKARKGRDAGGARGRWKSTEHVNEVGSDKYYNTYFTILLVDFMIFQISSSTVFNLKDIKYPNHHKIVAYRRPKPPALRCVSPARPIPFDTHVEHRRRSFVAEMCHPLHSGRRTSDDLQSFLSE